jgi:hypothetical protein
MVEAHVITVSPAIALAILGLVLLLVGFGAWKLVQFVWSLFS